MAAMGEKQMFAIRPNERPLLEARLIVRNGRYWALPDFTLRAILCR